MHPVTIRSALLFASIHVQRPQCKDNMPSQLSKSIGDVIRLWNVVFGSAQRAFLHGRLRRPDQVHGPQWARPMRMAFLAKNPAATFAPLLDIFATLCAGCARQPSIIHRDAVHRQRHGCNLSGVICRRHPATFGVREEELAADCGPILLPRDIVGFNFLFCAGRRQSARVP